MPIPKISFYVFPLFLYIIFIGIRSLAPQTFHIYKLFIQVFIFCLLRLLGFNFEFIDLIVIVLGIWISKATIDLKGIFFDKRSQMITIPGSKFLLIFLLFYFCLKFFINYQIAIAKVIEFKNQCVLLNNLASSFFAGIMLGRVIFIYRACFSSR